MKDMRKTLLLLAALLPLTGMAAETGDTTFVVNSKKIVVADSAGITKISGAGVTVGMNPFNLSNT